MHLTGRSLLAYLTLCIVWGSTYLAIRIGVQHLPPALFGAIRFVLAGMLMLAAARALRRPLPKRLADWQTNAVVGLLLLTGANGLVIWAEQYVASGVASIFIVTVSLWLAVFDAVIPGSPSRPTLAQFAGLLVGFAATVLLVGADLGELRTADWRGPLALTSAAVLWSLGSIYSQRRRSTSGPYANSAVQMLAGGGGLLAIGTLGGEWQRFQFSWPGFGAIAYLIVFGSIIGFTAYVYVLRHLPATIAGTYAYVNTVVAVLLGWLVLDEAITGRTLVSMAVVITAVVWVKAASRAAPARPMTVTAPPRREPAAPDAPPATAPDGAPVGERERDPSLRRTGT